MEIVSRSVLIGLFCVTGAFGAAKPKDVTITSDALEFLNQGAQTKFKGNVRLVQPPQELLADEMVQLRSTQIVEARGHIRGTWRQDDGSFLIARSENARYTPNPKKLEWWNEAQMERYQVAGDTAPVRATADQFSYFPETQRLIATSRVTVGQATQWQASSESGIMDVAKREVTLTGKNGAALSIDDPKLKGTFHSDQLVATQNPAVLSLIGNAKGTVQAR